MILKVRKWGNSQGVLLPKHVLKVAEISIGDELDVIVQSGQILLRKVYKQNLRLEEIVARMPQDYQVVEESFGQRCGKEEW